MSDIAAHLVDAVLPEVPVRQWVCALPWRLRCALGYDRRLCADVLGAFTDALKRSLRWRAKRKFGLRSVRDAQIGAHTFVQRADSALRLNVHFHTLALDGVYVRNVMVWGRQRHGGDYVVGVASRRFGASKLHAAPSN